MSSPETLAIQRSRGMRDLLPAGMRAFRRVEDAFRAAASRWGYEEVRTPTIETYSLFTVAGGLTPHMLSRVYSFLDWDGWSGERVVLRPDSTIPVARAAAEAGMALPARLFYVQNVFRFSREDDREDWQCGIEYLGAPPAIGDLEVAALACETLEALGQAPVVRLGHIGVTRAVAAAAGANQDALDAVAESGLAALRPSVNGNAQLAAFVDVALQGAAGTALLDNLRALAPASLPGAIPALEELSGVARALADAGRGVAIDFAIPGDFEYYTGVVFEFQSGGRSWGKGGRYSPGVPGTPDTACGLALHAGELAAHLAPASPRRMTVAVIPAAAGDMGQALTIARRLHRSGVAAALAQQSGDCSVSVSVDGATMQARTPAGESMLTTLDDLVGLLVQFK